MQNMKKSNVAKPQRPLVYKLIVAILVPLIVVFAIVLLANYRLNKHDAEQRTEQYLSQLCARYATALDGSLKEVMRQTMNMALSIKLQPRPDSLALRSYLHSNVSENPFLSGLAFAFEPYRYSLDRRLYCPYLCRKGNQIIPLDVSDSYDYTLSNWYIPTRNSSAPAWTDPYLGGASKELNATYTYPAKDGDVFYGIAAADLSLTNLTKDLSALKLPGAYVFLVSKSGTFISHPNPDWIMAKNLDLVAKEAPEYQGLRSRMNSAQSGISKTDKHWIVHQQIPSTQWIFAAVISKHTVLQNVRTQLLKQLLLFCLGLIIIIAAIIVTAISITRPIGRLSLRAQQIAAGDLDSPGPSEGSRDEIEELSKAFSVMTSELKQQITNVAAMAEARAKVESELVIARDIQQSLLPHVFPPFPQRREFSLSAQMIPAREVAGDFFDFFFLDPQRLVLLIADVSGKGIPAALFMAVTRTLLKTACDAETGPAEALNKVNRILSCDNDNCMFTTIFIGIYEVQSGELCYANAGHLPPLLFSAAGQLRSLASLGDPALGIVEDYQYHQDCTVLQPGDRMVLYTDGVTEAQNNQDELYGLTRFTELLQESLADPIEQVQQHIQDELIRYQGAELADDITMLFFGRKL